MRLSADTRAQSMTYLKALGTLILFAGFYAVFQEPVQMMFGAAETVATTDQATEGRQNIITMWTWLPLAAIGLLLIWVISSSIRQSGGLR